MRLALWSALLLTVALCWTDSTKADLFLLIDGIPGDSQEGGREDWIDVSQFGIAFSQEDVGLSKPRPVLSFFDVQAPASIASPPILLTLLNGDHIRDMELAITETIAGKQVEVATWEFDDVYVTNFRQTSTGGAAVDTYSFDLEALEYTYRSIGEDGQVGGQTTIGFNFKTNTSTFAVEGDPDDFQFLTGTLQPVAVPEPTVLTLGLIGVMCFGGARMICYTKRVRARPHQFEVGVVGATLRDRVGLRPNTAHLHRLGSGSN